LSKVLTFFLFRSLLHCFLESENKRFNSSFVLTIAPPPKKRTRTKLLAAKKKVVLDDSATDVSVRLSETQRIKQGLRSRVVETVNHLFFVWSSFQSPAVFEAPSMKKGEEIRRAMASANADVPTPSSARGRGRGRGRRAIP
jgi:hypothetical protein